jgi:hypothetical protein
MTAAAPGEHPDLDQVGRVLEALIRRSGRQVTTLDRATGVIEPISTELASAPFGLLPVFLVAGDTVWRDATGTGLGVELRADPQALLGHQVVGVGGPFSTVMLSMMEAIERVATLREVPAHLLLEQWQDTTERLARDAPPAPTSQLPRAASPGPRP